MSAFCVSLSAGLSINPLAPAETLFFMPNLSKIDICHSRNFSLSAPVLLRCALLQVTHSALNSVNYHAWGG